MVVADGGSNVVAAAVVVVVVVVGPKKCRAMRTVGVLHPNKAIFEVDADAPVSSSISSLLLPLLLLILILLLLRLVFRKYFFVESVRRHKFETPTVARR